MNIPDPEPHECVVVMRYSQMDDPWIDWRAGEGTAVVGGRGGDPLRGDLIMWARHEEGERTKWLKGPA